uniref:HNH endonuclease n=1 Tax=viral metagenome TaxID=1070528 RepID=A0A6M3IGC8_9ZZZZ
MKRYCPKCSQEKSINEFGLRKKGGQNYQWACKKCHCIASQKNYQKNKDRYRVKAREWDKKRKKKLHQVVWKYLQTHPCIDCGEKDIVVLHFDHLRNKIANISYMINSNYPVRKILKEIKKCEVRCANCHMRKTAKQFGWLKLSHSLKAQLEEQNDSNVEGVGSSPI